MPYNLRKRAPAVQAVQAAPQKKQKKAHVLKGAKLFVFGQDSCGELGQGKIGFNAKSPKIVHLEPVKQVACGPMHIVTLLKSGEVYTNGCNDEGALGRITDSDEKLDATPTLISISSKIIKVTAGDSHSAALSIDNEVFIWGNFRDEHGSVGLTTDSNGQPIFEPLKIMPETKFQDIASGSNHMLLLDVDGVVYSFGVGAQGQLGRLKPEEVGEEGKAYAITEENRDLFLTPKKVDLKNVDPQRPFVCDAVYAGNNSSFATNTDKKKNRLAGWGLNNYFQLGYKGKNQPSKAIPNQNDLIQYYPRRSTFTCSTSIINVACGQHHTLFLTKTGRVYAAGRHDYGMLGLTKPSVEVCPAKQIESLGSTIIDISAGINTSFAVNSDGKLFSWGMGGYNLGLQDEEDLKSPTEVGCFEDKKVLGVSAGASFTAAVAD